LEFQITQHNRDEQLMKSLENYLGCGKLYGITDSHCRFIVTKFNDLTEKIIPFFNKYPIVGVKAEDFADFKRVMEKTNESQGSFNVPPSLREGGVPPPPLRSKGGGD
jgi:LAGLIDADG endonuclease